jgi:hypothetical protein
MAVNESPDERRSALASQALFGQLRVFGPARLQRDIVATPAYVEKIGRVAGRSTIDNDSVDKDALFQMLPQAQEFVVNKLSGK